MLDGAMMHTIEAVGDPFAGVPAGRRALIVGAGIGGLAAGIALRRAGWSVVVAERAREVREVGAGIALWANGIAALEWLGVGAEVGRDGLVLPPPSLRTDQGEILFTGGIDSAAKGRSLVLVMHRADLQQILLRALRRSGGRVLCDTPIRDLTQDVGGVTVGFDGDEPVRADLVIGADGIMSTVRAQLHGEGAPRYAGYTAWRAVVTGDTNRIATSESWGRGARFGMAPLSDGRTYWFATKDASEGARSSDGEKAELLRTFGSWHDPIARLIEATDEALIMRHDVYDRPPLAEWGRGRVTLVGDAAHPMTPNLGQGACQALEDAVALARALRAPGEIPVSEALRTYETMRRERAHAYVRRSRQAGTIGQSSNPLAVRLRNAAARHLFPYLFPMTVADVLRHGIPTDS
jgi:2-polyprenyl-6-methoxyphenol hydroxylase-like FAD-dependent oxidoreductase